MKADITELLANASRLLHVAVLAFERNDAIDWNELEQCANEIDAVLKEIKNLRMQ